MAELVASGRLVDAILVLVALEAVGLVAYRALTGRGVAALDLLPNLASGLCLMLALRAALTRASWGWIAGCLTVALLAHAADLYRRWR